MLIDTQIKELVEKKRIVISFYDKKRVAPAAYYFRLGGTLLIPKPDQTIDPSGGANPEYDKISIVDNDYILKPGGFVLGQTLESLTLPKDVGMLIDGRTTMARLGVTIHKTAIFIHPGHTDSIITLEIYNAGNFNIKLKQGLEIAKGIFFKSSEEVENEYKDVGIYPHQKEVMGAILS